jgi:hypothetical protein
MATFRLWFWRLFLVALVAVVYSILPEPLDKWFGILTGLAIAIWVYNRATPRFNLQPIPLKFERVETITLTQVLMGLILLIMIASFRELVSIKDETSDVQNSVTNFQHDASNDADEIKSKLDNVTSAVEANQ